MSGAVGSQPSLTRSLRPEAAAVSSFFFSSSIGITSTVPLVKNLSCSFRVIVRNIASHRATEAQRRRDRETARQIVLLLSVSLSLLLFGSVSLCLCGYSYFNGSLNRLAET